MTGTNDTTAYDAIARIAAAYAARSDVSADDIVDLVARLAGRLGVAGFAPGQAAAGLRPGQSSEPAVAIDKAVRADRVFCLCCGKGFKMLKRHLGAEHGLSEQGYRALFGLPEDFPLVAPDYSARKAAFARKAGLGTYDRHEDPAGSPRPG